MRPGLTVRSRTGYLDTLPTTRRRPFSVPNRTPVEAALASPSLTPGVGMRVSAVPFKGPGRDATIAMVVDIDAADLSFNRKNGTFTAGIELRHLAVDANHRIFPEYRYRTTMTLDAGNYQRVSAGRVRVISEFEVPRGRYQVRVASATGTGTGSVVYDLEVPDFAAAGPLAMSGVVLATLSPADAAILQPGQSRRSNQKSKQCRSAVCEATTVRESPLVAWRSSRGANPVLLGRLPAVPTTVRDFASGETLVAFAEVYDPPGQGGNTAPRQITLTAALRDAAGAVARTVPGEASATDQAPGRHPITLRLPLTGVAAGSYVLAVEAAAAGDVSSVVRRAIPIRVR